MTTIAFVRMPIVMASYSTVAVLQPDSCCMDVRYAAVAVVVVAVDYHRIDYVIDARTS